MVPSRLSLGDDRNRLWHAERMHPVQDSASQHSLHFLCLCMSRVELATQDLLGAKEGILHAALSMIAGRLLPLPTPHRVPFEHRFVSRRER